MIDKFYNQGPSQEWRPPVGGIDDVSITNVPAHTDTGYADLGYLLSMLDELESATSELFRQCESKLSEYALSIATFDDTFKEAHSQVYPSDETPGYVTFDEYKWVLQNNTSQNTQLVISTYEQSIRGVSGTNALDISLLTLYIHSECRRIRTFIEDYIGEVDDSSELRTIEIFQDWAEDTKTIVYQLRQAFLQTHPPQGSISNAELDKLTKEQASGSQALFQAKLNVINNNIVSQFAQVAKNWEGPAQTFYNKTLGPALKFRLKVGRSLSDDLKPADFPLLSTEIASTTLGFNANLEVALSDCIRRNQMFFDLITKIMANVAQRDTIVYYTHQLAQKGKPLPNLFIKADSVSQATEVINSQILETTTSVHQTQVATTTTAQTIEQILLTQLVPSSSIDFQGRLKLTENSIFGYDDEGKLSFGYFGDDIQRTNLILNPSFELDLGAIEPINPETVLEHDTTEGFYGTASLKVSSEPDSGGTGFYFTQADRFDVEADKGYVVSLHVKVPEDQTNLYLTCAIQFYNAFGDPLGIYWAPTTHQIEANGEWTRIFFDEIHSPDNSVKAGLRIQAVNALPVDGFYHIDALMVEDAESPDIFGEYFDGDTVPDKALWTGVDHNSASTLQYNVGDVIITGNLQVSEIHIGGFDDDSFHVDEDGNMWSGAADSSSANFKVSAEGIMEAVNGIFAGTITSESGTIGGFSIGSSTLTAGSGSSSVGVSTGASTSSIAFYAGNATATSAPFRVSTAGALTSTSGTIGGFTIGSSTLTAGGTSDGVGISTGSGTSNISFWAGHTTPTSAEFRVTNAGALTATNATITGTVSSSTISGSTISGGSISIGTSPNWFRVDTNGNIWLGGSSFSNADFRVSNVGTVRIGSGTDNITLSQSGGVGKIAFNGSYTSSPGIESSNDLEIYANSNITVNGGLLSVINGGSGFISVSTGTVSLNASSTIQNTSSWFVASAVWGQTGTGTTVVVDNTGTLYRQTSSIKYKKDVEDLWDLSADKILDLRPVWFRSTSPNDNPEWSYYGFIAEEVAEIEPRLVNWAPSENCDCYDEDLGSVTEFLKTKESVDDDDLSKFRPKSHKQSCLKPESVDYARLTPLMLSIIRRQKTSIEDLEKRIVALEEEK